MKTSTASLVALGAFIVAGLGYAVYFDYARRNNPEFRRKLARQRRKAAKVREREDELNKSLRAKKLKEILTEVLSEKLPTSDDSRQSYFVTHLSQGESAAATGDEDHAVACFYKAFKVYPRPLDLLVMYQKMLPVDVFQGVLTLMDMEVSRKKEEYFEKYPPAHMNVRLVAPIKDGPTKMAAVKQFEEGDVIFEEDPIASALQYGLEDLYCSFTLKRIDPSTAVTNDNVKGVVYADEASRDADWDIFRKYLAAKDDGQEAEDPAASTEAEFLDKCREEGVLTPVLIAKFLGKLIRNDLERQKAGREEEEYTAYDHMDRLQGVLVSLSPMTKAMRTHLLQTIGSRVDGFAQLLTDERYLNMTSKFLYNAIAIHTAPDQDETAPESTMKETARTADAQSQPTGHGVYLLAGHLQHSSEPNVRITFPTGTHRIALMAARTIQPDEILAHAYVPVEGRSEEAIQNDMKRLYTPRLSSSPRIKPVPSGPASIDDLE